MSSKRTGSARHSRRAVGSSASPDSTDESTAAGRLLLPLLESLPVLDGGEEGPDHLGAAVVAVCGVEFREPVVEAGAVGVASEIAEVLHRDEGRVELLARELVVFDD